MNDFLQKLIGMEIKIANDKGQFDLFALFSSDEEPDNKWDLVVSAAWIGEDNKVALSYLSSQLNNSLDTQELLSISKIVPLDVYDPRVIDIQRIVPVEHSLKFLPNYSFYGFKVDKIYVITAKLQANERLMNLVWEIIVQMWKAGNRKIESKSILEELERRGEQVPDYALDRILEYFLATNRINGAQFLGSHAIRRHGNMVITQVNLNSPPTSFSVAI